MFRVYFLSRATPGTSASIIYVYLKKQILHTNSINGMNYSIRNSKTTTSCSLVNLELWKLLLGRLYQSECLIFHNSKSYVKAAKSTYFFRFYIDVYIWSVCLIYLGWQIGRMVVKDREASHIFDEYLCMHVGSTHIVCM
jgi:hypothetical protein